MTNIKSILSRSHHTDHLIININEYAEIHVIRNKLVLKNVQEKLITIYAIVQNKKTKGINTINTKRARLYLKEIILRYSGIH